MIIFIFTKGKDADFGCLFYLIAGLFLLVGTFMGISMFPYLFVWFFTSLYGLLFLLIGGGCAFAANYFSMRKCWEWWKSWLLGAEIFAVLFIIMSIIDKSLEIWDMFGDKLKIIYYPVIFIGTYVGGFLAGAVISGLCTYIANKIQER